MQKNRKGEKERGGDVAKTRSPDREKAFELYKNTDMLLKDIAAEIGVSENTVRSWKSRYDWDNATQRKRNVATNVKKLNNKNAVTTGEYESIMFDTLDEDELKLIESIDDDKVKLLMQDLKLLTVRERRMLKRIDTLTKKELTLVEQKEVDGVEGSEVEQDYELSLIQIQNIEEALTRVQDKKRKTVETLHKFEIDNSKLELEIMKFELTALKDETTDETENDGFIEALTSEVEKVWNDDE